MTETSVNAKVAVTGVSVEAALAVGELLQSNSPSLPVDFWYWLRTDRAPTMAEANKFYLACILDWQIRAEVAWENARRLAEDILGDPEDLWGTIAEIGLEKWMARRKEYGLHRFAAGHRRVYTIGCRVQETYGGDVRKVWVGQTISTTITRLSRLGTGEQLTRMTVGALIDTGHLQGIADVKADTHVCRVLGRALRGTPLSVTEATTMTRWMCPVNPWLLDRPLFYIGRGVCRAESPECSNCDLSAVCAYHNRPRLT